MKNELNNIITPDYKNSSTGQYFDIGNTDVEITSEYIDNEHELKDIEFKTINLTDKENECFVALSFFFVFLFLNVAILWFYINKKLLHNCTIRGTI